MTNAQEIYHQAVRHLPVQERLRLAALILDEIAEGGDFPPRPALNEEQRRAALEELMQHAGVARSGNPRSADNEQIDADLAQEYGKDL